MYMGRTGQRLSAAEPLPGRIQIRRLFDKKLYFTIIALDFFFYNYHILVMDNRGYLYKFRI